ncbi:MAG: SDR family NAD(P)-dependent oxidoreductase [Legionella sp.]|nr:SDR family NAD(P)-dependent oxidoreductase [Legionella sp.]
MGFKNRFVDKLAFHRNQIKHKREGLLPDSNMDMAIIGMACRFAGAKDYSTYWENLKNGLNSISEINKDRWDPEKYYSTDFDEDNKSNSKWAGLIDDIYGFDPSFFSISPREAVAMDPQQRLLLQEAYRCIEDAGINLQKLQQKKTSIFVGVMSTDYQERMASLGKIDSYACLGNYECILANRISHFFGFTGISKSIDTACSSSLVAIHEARQSLLLEESDYAFIGGVNTICHPMKYIAFSKSRMLSPTGQCYAFDKDANGYVPGEGIAIVLVTTLKTAIEQGHRIHAVIKGSAVNHSGRTSSLTAPSVEAQCEVIQNALLSAGITAEQISYVEAHGTGTSLGDPIEIEGLTRAFNTPKKQYCYLGSVKTNIGHCEAAAGLAGLIKTVLMMQHEALVPTLNIRYENPLIDFQNSPFQLVRQSKPWSKSQDEIRYAGISSFGFGGVNAHVVLQESLGYKKDKKNTPVAHTLFPILYSAADKDGLENMCSNWEKYVTGEQFQQQSLADISYTLMHGRTEFKHRFAMLIDSKQEFEQVLRQAKLIQPHTSGKSHLIIGEIAGINHAIFQKLLQTYKPFNKTYSHLCNLLIQVGGKKYLKRWAKESKNSNKLLNQFIVLYSIGKLCVDHACSLQSISGERVGQLVGAVLSGWIELKEALLWLCNPKKIKNLNFKQPTLPIYDGYLGLLLNPHIVSPEYIQCLHGNALEEGNRSLGLLEQLFKQAQQLNENQYTFKGYLEKWQNAIELHPIHWHHCFNKESSYPILLVIILSSCIKKLFLKWQLKETILENRPSLTKIIELLQDELLSYDDVITLFTQLDAQPYQNISQRINDKLTKKNEPALYARHQIQEAVINTDPTGWLNHLGQVQLADKDIHTLLNYSLDSQIISIGHINYPDIMSVNTIEENEFTQSLLSLWENGLLDRIHQLFDKQDRQLVTLPNYPFAKERYLIPSHVHQNDAWTQFDSPCLHPLLDKNSSDASKTCFKTKLHKDAFYLRDHVINNSAILPAAVTLELARVAGQISIESGHVLSLENVIWGQPILADDNKSIQIALTPEGLKIAFEVSSASDDINTPLVQVQGYVIVGEDKESLTGVTYAHESVNTIASRCSEEMAHAELYSNLKAMGFNYGHSLRSIEWLKLGKNEALSKLELAEVNISDPDRTKYVLHPALLDAALQSMVSLELTTVNQGTPLPFSVERVEILDAIPNSCYVHVRRSFSGSQFVRYDAEILGAEGEIHVRIKGLALRYMQVPIVEMPSIQLYQHDWEVAAVEEIHRSKIRHLLIFANDSAELINQLKTNEPAIQIIQVNVGEAYQQISSEHYLIRPGKQADYEQLLKDLNLSYPNIIWNHMVNVWSEPTIDNLQPMNQHLAKNYYHLLALTQVMSARKFPTIHLLHIYNEEEHRLIVDEMNLGFVKTVNKENPNYFYQLVRLGKEFQNPPALATIIEQEFNQREQIHIHYDKGNRLVSLLRPIALEKSDIHSNLKQSGIYLITGGLGGLGLVFARYLAEHYKAKLVLTGRTPLDMNRQKLIDSITQFGAEVLYLAGDITQAYDVDALIKKAEETFGKLNGIIHAAGYVSDAFIVKQTEGEAQAMFDPKVLGIMNLDEYSKDNKELDYFISFSSIVSLLGNIGQSAYASANAFLDEFCKYRNQLVAQGKRHGRSISINWPLWAEGGMGHDEETQKTLCAAFGVELLTNEAGLEAFSQIMQSKVTQAMPIFANQDLFQSRLRQSNHVKPTYKKTQQACDPESWRQQARDHLKHVIASGLQLSPERLHEDKAFEQYGIDSILSMSLTSILEKEYGPLPKTLFFEYQNLATLTDYFLENHSEKCEALVAKGNPSVNQLNENKVEANGPFHFEAKAHSNSPPAHAVTDVAIIGMAGRYPMANNPAELWNNLKAAKDCVIEIPRERWDYNQYYNPDKKKPGISYSKWGGFIEDFDKFDPLFFNISPREAELMDPQERLFLEVAWQTLEDAGYSLQAAGTSIGVYVGVMYGQYQLYGVEEMLKGNTSITNSFYSSIANRVSYYLNSHGPSMAIDTMCSSSLTSIHLACESINRGECDIALAGGVNISSHPNKYLLLSQGQFLSTDGKCRSFGEGGDGYVPGEGVGAVLLKPLSKAVADRDHIYGVIKGNSINHGGKTNGYTVPNPVAQAELIKTALEKANINPRTISYLEAHGTGTSLGDPIELRGLAKAFAAYGKSNQFCAIGSVKSNVGHLESAAGIVAITKVLLQLQHQQLAPSLHSEIINSNCDFIDSPFYIQRELGIWDRPIIDEQGRQVVYPRRAGISSFGAGGSNAHCIIEEAPELPAIVATIKPYYLVTLSAQTQEALKQRQMDLLAWIGDIEGNNKHTIADISYTLNYGREHYNFRLAIVIQNIDSLQQQLVLALEAIKSDCIFTGVVNLEESRNDKTLVLDIINKLKAQTLQNPETYFENIKSLSEQYVQGATINWKLFYRGEVNHRLSLPTYPFSKKRYWVRSNKLELILKETEKLKPLTLKNIYSTQVPVDLTENRLPKLDTPKEQLMVVADTSQTDNQLITIFKQVLFLEDSDIDVNHNFNHYGVDSILGVEIINKINKTFNLKLQATVIYNYPTIKTLSKYLISILDNNEKATLNVSIPTRQAFQPESSQQPQLTIQETLISPSPQETRKKSHSEAYKQGTIPSTSKISLSNLSTIEDTYTENEIATPPRPQKLVETIAIVGASIELPQIDSLPTFWEHLAAGSNLVSEVPVNRWALKDFYDPNPQAKHRSISKWGGFITNVDEFDPSFFNISPIEAEYMDPQQRLFLKHCFNALEDAGYSTESLNGSRCGIYVGLMNQDYNQLLAQNNREIGHYSVTGNAPSILAGRVAYYLNINGPVITMDTACSSSLVAMHLAIKTLLDGEADAMLVGGVTLWLAQSSYIGMSQSEMLSADGLCKTFDNKADGFVPGEGLGVVLLKRLSDAERDGDHIYAVIKGSGVNQDGYTNGITAPNGLSQAQLEKEIYRRYQIDVNNISYIETHGTGTKLGDPIEISALIDSFSEFTADTQFCGLGSVKTNVGHTGAAAGIVGVIKTLLCLQHQKLVPSLHFETPNEHIPFSNSPFYVNTELKAWKPIQDKPRMAAISSFGFSGTNAHLVIEEYPSNTSLKECKPYYLVTLSAKTEEAFKQKIIDVIAWLKDQTPNEVSLESISYTLNIGRNHYNHRGSWVVADIKSLQQELLLSFENKSSECGFKGIITKDQKHDDDAIYQKVLEGTFNELELGLNPDPKHYRNNLRVLANLYIKGYSIDWQLLHQKETKRRISLPTYPFAKESYWISPLKNHAVREQLFLQKEWIENASVDSSGISSFIVVYDIKSEKLAQQLVNKNQNILLINTENALNLHQNDLSLYEGWIDISSQDSSNNQDNWIGLLQLYLESRKPLTTRLLQVTQGVESLQNANIHLRGAEKIGLYRMLQNEYSWVTSKHLDLDPKIIDEQKLSNIILNELACIGGEQEICYRDNGRFYSQLKPFVPKFNKTNFQFTAQEVLLVTGGTKGIGLLCAKHCILKYGLKKIVLTGRELFPPKSEWQVTRKLSKSLQDKIKNIKELESLGVHVEVLSLRLDDLQEVSHALAKITMSMGPIVGIIHAAGVIDSQANAFIQKSVETIHSVLSPKIKGLKHLLDVVDVRLLKCVILCSSVSAIIPSLAIGYSDYAMANAYMDYYAMAHNAQFPIVSIQWPSWKETGFGEVTSHAYQQSGLLSITNEEALAFLDIILMNLNHCLVMPLIVNAAQFDTEQLLKIHTATTDNGLGSLNNKHSSSLQDPIQNWLLTLFEQELKMKQGTLDKDKAFTDLGMDSIFLTQILRKINHALLLDLSVSIFFERSSIVHLSEWLVAQYPEQISLFLENETTRRHIGSVDNCFTEPKSREWTKVGVALNNQQASVKNSPTTLNEDIAVIGMSCQFAGGGSLDDYWDILSQGNCAITPVPMDCWGVKTNYYAGLIDKIYEFDADFFKIGRGDIQAMDPQAILLLKESLKTIYHSGYTLQEVNGQKTGVYIGGRSNHAVGHKMLEKTRNPIMVLGQNYLSANISQFFNFQGPSLVIDTACSSALVGMNMAIEALLANKIQSALVGGVSVLTSPFAHQIFERRNLLQEDGQFHILDKRASGIVLGEGAGMVYLKSLSRAQLDGDTIYAVIAGISINNDGKTIGPAAPNIEAQKEVMREALIQSGIQPKDIQYIDVNGSGSELTDLLEIKAIEAIYRDEVASPCYLGSMKPNIGHPLCAQGIASFIKVTLMLYHQKMVPFLSGHQPMKHHQLDPDKFRFARELKSEAMRYAALNSFADGGTNAHVILKQYQNNSRLINHTPKPIPAMNLVDIRTFESAEQEEA